MTFTVTVHPAFPDSLTEAVRGLLAESDAEFLPPLSRRGGTFGDAFDDGVPEAYLEGLRHEAIATATEGGELIGFVSFVPEFDCPELGCRCTYLTTGIVREGHRGKGVARALVERIVAETSPGLPIGTRTWSSNEASRALLESLGFRVGRTLKDHRGKGVDTLYYVREAEGRNG